MQYEKTGNKIRKLQDDVDETAGLMKQNVERVIERGEKLDELNERAGELEGQARGFRQSSQKLKKKYWWQNTKRLMCIIGICVAVIIVIIIIVIVSLRPWTWNSTESKTEISTPNLIPPTAAGQQ